MSQVRKMRAVPVLLALMLALLGTGAMDAAAQSKSKPGPPLAPTSAQVIAGFPMTISVLDNTQMSIEFTNALVAQDRTQQFYSAYAEGVFLWAAHDASSAMKVFGPAYMPGGHTVNAFAAVSNSLAGSGTPADPWIVTTVNDVPGTKLRLVQETIYVNGSEYVKLNYKLSQMGGTEPVAVSIFHAADLQSSRADGLGYGYFNALTGGVGDYVWIPTDRNMYQQFVPKTTVAAYQEGTYEAIWDKIGDATAIGPGFNNTVVANELHDTAIGLQWNVTVPEVGQVSVSDTAFFGPHENLAGAFSDVASNYPFYDYVYDLGANGIAAGYSNGTFLPGNNATRGQVCKMVVMAQGWPIDTTGGPHFSDVAVGSTFYNYIETAFNHSAIIGYDDGTFHPNANITRAQTVKIVVRAKNWPIDTTGGPHFTDVAVGSTFYNFIETAFNHGIINGYPNGTFLPGAMITRGQISKVVDLTR